MASKKSDLVALECGRRLKEAREAQGWSQLQLAKASGYRSDRDVQRGVLKPSTIGMWEQGRRRIGLEEARALSKVLTEYPPAYFMAAITEQEARVLKALEGPESARSQLPFPAVTPRHLRSKDSAP